MAQHDERMNQIGSAILSQANAEAKEIIQKANDIREKEIADCEEQIVQGMYSRIQQRTNALRLESVREVARARIRAHRGLLLRREELTSLVFARVRGRLIEYAASPEYGPALLAGISAVKDDYDHAYSTVYVRESDLGFVQDIKSLTGCREVCADPAILIGGFMLKNDKARVLVDETLDTKLVEQKPWFLLNCGMRLELGDENG